MKSSTSVSCSIFKRSKKVLRRIRQPPSPFKQWPKRISKAGCPSWRDKSTFLVRPSHQKLKCKVTARCLSRWSRARREISIDELDEAGIDFVKKCIQIVECRGLHEQGLYRMVGMQSKVNSVVTAHFGNCRNSDMRITSKASFVADPHKSTAQKLSTPVDEEMDLKTVCSSLKLYLRTLKEPVFTFKLHNRFIEAASKVFAHRANVGELTNDIISVQSSDRW